MPNRAHDTDLGIDFFIPEIDEKLRNNLLAYNPKLVIGPRTIEIPPHTDILIPSGIRMILPEGYGLDLINKSGVATYNKLTIGAELIDTGYNGEIHFNLFNHSDKPSFITAGNKIVQGILVQNYITPLWEIGESEFDRTCERYNHQRNSDGFGSTQIVK